MTGLPGQYKYLKDLDEPVAETDRLKMEILHLVRKQMGLEQSYKLELDDTASSIGADSLDQVELLMSIEDEYNLADCIETNFTGSTIGDLVEYVRFAERDKKLHTPINPQHFLDDSVYVRELASHNPGKLVLGIQTVLIKTQAQSKIHDHVIVNPRSSFCVYQYGETVLDTNDFHLAVKMYNKLLNTPAVPVP